MSGVAFLRYLAAAATLVAVAHGQTTSALNGQHGSSFPGACPIDKFSDVIVTTVATLPESTTGPLTLAYSAASNFPFGNPVAGFQTSPTWNLQLNNSATYFATPNSPTSGSSSGSVGTPGTPMMGGISGLKFFGECKQNLLTLQATCSFVFDYSTRRLLDLLSKATPAGGIPLGGTVTFQFCTLALGNSQVSSPTCFESRGGAPKPVIVKISSKEPADVIPPIGFNACYKDVVGSPYKCLAFSIVQSCADSSMLAIGAPVSGPIASPSGTTAGVTVAGSGAAGVSVAGTSGSSQSIANGQGSSLSSTQAVAGAQPTGAYAPAGTQGYTAQPTAASTLTPSQQIYNQGAQVVGQGAKQAKQEYSANLQALKQQQASQQGRRLKD